MTCSASEMDTAYRDSFEKGEVLPKDFRHRDHLKLAFVYLCEGTPETATTHMRTALLKFLADNNVPPGKYHETLTASWTYAVRHFMDKSPDVTSFDAFLSQDDRLLDTQIMLSHYTKETLFSDEARAAFVDPDLEPIPVRA